MVPVPDAGDPLPPVAAWRHLGGREGFEVVRLTPLPGGLLLEGSTSAVEEGRAWWVRYAIELDDAWRAVRARLAGASESGEHRRTLDADGPGRWLVDGTHDPALDGCLDVDLESSACTNTAPVHRLDLRPGGRADAPAAYVRAEGLGVERLEQSYARPVDPGPGGDLVLHYVAPRFGFEADLRFDRHGLVVDYPGLALRTR